METKALKKQLGAAIAMVLVAAVALGSATYAWFVTNNEVKATTTTISAQSNAAFMTIANGKTGASTANTTEVTTAIGADELYPATLGEETGSIKGTWMTGYGTDLTNAELKGNLIKCVGTAGTTAGTTEAATSGEFALQQEYNISAKNGQTLSDLKVKEVTAGTTEFSLKSALRILVTNSDGTVWAVYGLSENQSEYELKLSSSDLNSEVTFASKIEAGTDTAVHVYLYYEGSDSSITTANLVNGKLSATNAVTVTFTATPNNK